MKDNIQWAANEIEQLRNENDGLRIENKQLRMLMRKAFDRCADVAFELELPREFCDEALRDVLLSDTALRKGE